MCPFCIQYQCSWTRCELFTRSHNFVCGGGSRGDYLPTVITFPSQKTGSCLEELICMRDKKTTTGNERETMTKKWTWIPHRDMASNEPRRHVQKIRLTGTPKWSELWNCSTMKVKHGCLAWTRCIHLFEAWLKPPVYMCFLRILNKIQVLGMLMTNQILFIKRF